MKWIEPQPLAARRDRFRTGALAVAGVLLLHNVALITYGLIRGDAMVWAPGVLSTACCAAAVLALWISARASLTLDQYRRSFEREQRFKDGLKEGMEAGKLVGAHQTAQRLLALSEQAGEGKGAST